MFQKTALWEPSYDQGFARDASEAAYPNLWEELLFNWHGPLGVTGIGTDSIKDTSGYDNDGTPSGMAASAWVMTEKGYGLAYSGANEQITLGNPALLDGLPAISVSLWVYFNASAGDYDLVLKGNHTDNQPFLFWYDEAGTDAYRIQVTDEGGTNSGSLTSASIPVIGAWQHLVVTFANEQVRLFINGIEDGNSPWAVPGVNDVSSGGAVGGNWWFGTGTTPGNKTLNGQIADIGIWNRALAFNEIQQLFVDEHAIVRPRLAVPLSSGAAPAAGIEAFKYYYDQQEAVACG